MRTLSLALLLPALLAADVVVLKDGGAKVAGRVADKGGHWEVTTEQGLRTFLKEEVERVITSPDEFIVEAPGLYESAKADFLKITAPDAPKMQNEAVRAAVEKLAKARALYADTRELFPEDKHAVLDTKLVQVMQLTRLLRDRLGSEIAKGPAGPTVTAKPSTSPPPPAALPPLEAAFATLVDAAKRADPAARKAAREAFLAHRTSAPGVYDLATAAALFLAKPEPAGAPLQEYFGKPWFKTPLQMTPAQHLEAAVWLAGKKDVELFALGHLGHAPAGPEAEKAARALNFTVAGGVAGTLEGHAVRDMTRWVRAGDYELANRAYVSEHRSTADTAAVRFVWGFALLELAAGKQKGYERAVLALSGLKAADAALEANAAALVRSLKAATPCQSCLGDGWLRCTNCHGQKIIYVICKVCNGTRIKGGGLFCNPCKFSGIAAKLVCNKCKSGYFDCPKCKLPDCKACAGAGRSICKTCDGLRIIKKGCGVCMGSGLARSGAPDAAGSPFCGNCKGSGTEQITKCASCTGRGFDDCASCEPLRKPPAVEDVCAVAECAVCEGRGTPFKGAAYPCRSCAGLGLKLTPKLDPAKVLPD